MTEAGAMMAAAAACGLAFGAVHLSMRPLISALRARRMSVPDAFKPGTPMVLRPGGPAIAAGIISGCAVLYAFFGQAWVIAVALTTAAALIAGLVDDLRRMGAWYKPLALAACAAPILAIGAYDPNLEFPFFGQVSIPVLYIGVVVAMIVFTGNTINSIDIFNGLASAFVAIASAALAASLAILGRPEAAWAAAVLAVSCAAFYRYHKIPAKVFPGDSGALAMGAAYGAIAIAGGVEILAVIAMLPAIINSFLFLSSMRKVVEYRNIKDKPTELMPDFKLRATANKSALVTLVRVLLAGGPPQSEAQLSRSILKLAAVSACLAVATAAASEALA